MEREIAPAFASHTLIQNAHAAFDREQITRGQIDFRRPHWLRAWHPVGDVSKDASNRPTASTLAASGDGIMRPLGNVKLPEIPDDPDAIERKAVAKPLERACGMLRNRPVHDEVRTGCEQKLG